MPRGADPVTAPHLPPHLRFLERLGSGGGGEVWAVEDRQGQRLALKVLALEAQEGQLEALVREATILSGLEGTGLPRVHGFGRLPASRRPYLLRDLVPGTSLEQLAASGTASRSQLLGALSEAAERLTLLHRAGVLHGDLKPANIVVTPAGRAVLVDFGLAATWQRPGAALGLTARYAAPELLAGHPPEVRTDVYALGVSLRELLVEPPPSAALADVIARATHPEPSRRHPSADEFACELRRAAGLPQPPSGLEDAPLWPILGRDAFARELLGRVRDLAPGRALALQGPPGSGRSSLLRRLGWSLGAAGLEVLSVTGAVDGEELERAVAESHPEVLLVDDAGELPWSHQRWLRQQLEGGRRALLVGELPGLAAERLEVPPLDEDTAAKLVALRIPALTPRLVQRVVEAAEGWPGRLRASVERLATVAIASERQLQRVLAAAEEHPAASLGSVQQIVRRVEQGLFGEARALLEQLPATPSLELALVAARVDLGLGEPRRALERLAPLAAAARATPAMARAWELITGRAQLGTGDFSAAVERLSTLDGDDELAAEALAYQALARSFLGQPELAIELAGRAVTRAEQGRWERVAPIAATALGLVLQRAERLEPAERAYERAIEAAERVGEAAALATARLNLAGLLQIKGDLAGALLHYEGALDMGRRSGRLSTVRSARMNVANLDLYLGRRERAAASLEALGQEPALLDPSAQAQWLGLRAALAAASGDVTEALDRYQACGAAYLELSRPGDAAEAWLEGVLLASRQGALPPSELRRRFEEATALLPSGEHRALRELAAAQLRQLEGEPRGALDHAERALAEAQALAQRDWQWRALECRAALRRAIGQTLLARRDDEDALAVCEHIGAHLPRDLAEVYWAEPRRQALRERVGTRWGGEALEPAAERRAPADGSLGEGAIARILEVNADLAGLHDLPQLAARVITHAVQLLRAERGFVLLREAEGALSIYAARTSGGVEGTDAEFSRGVAERVIMRGEPLVSLHAGDDARFASYASVHALLLKSVACVPIKAPSGAAIGALYLETRARVAQHFERDLRLLSAFADQVSIAFENARLLTENRRRADELERTNQELERAREHLQELLGHRTAKLKRARQELRDTRHSLLGHFGYHGLVGTSQPMRRLYALIDRVRGNDVPVLITGESGTGKEVVARAIHQASERRRGPFLGVNCGAIPEQLLESELFGSVRGAFTGADRDRRGLLREAEGGTVLLDEIGEMPQKMQASLLRVLQERAVRPVGGGAEQPVDVRFIFATHRDLRALVEAGQFREDLYYRINVVELVVPPLRERREDIPQLVDHFFARFSLRYQRERKTLSRAALRRLTSHPWPGNVRQLENVLLNAWVLSDSSEIAEEELDALGAALGRSGAPPPGHAESALARAGTPSATTAVPAASAPRRPALGHQERERTKILEALERCAWNRVKAAQQLGIPRRTFYRRLRDYGIQ